MTVDLFIINFNMIDERNDKHHPWCKVSQGRYAAVKGRFQPAQ